MRKAFRKISALACIPIISLSAYASECDITFKGSTVNVSGSAEPGSSVGFLMYKTSGDKLNDASYIFQTKADEDGSFTIDFYMKDFSSIGEVSDVWTDDYTYIISHDDAEHSDTKNYLSYVERNKLIQAINGATDNNTFKNNRNIERLKAMGADTTAFGASADTIKEEVAEKLRENAPHTEFDEAGFLRAFNEAYVLTNLNRCMSSTAVSEFLKGNTANGIVIPSETLSNSLLMNYTGEYVFKKLTYSSLDVVNSDIAKAEILYNIVKADKQTMTNLVTGNSVTIGISGTAEYTKYISSSNTSVGINEKIILSLATTPVDNIEDFVELFKTTAQNYTPTSIDKSEAKRS